MGQGEGSARDQGWRNEVIRNGGRSADLMAVRFAAFQISNPVSCSELKPSGTGSTFRTDSHCTSVTPACTKSWPARTGQGHDWIHHLPDGTQAHSFSTLMAELTIDHNTRRTATHGA